MSEFRCGGNCTHPRIFRLRWNACYHAAKGWTFPPAAEAAMSPLNRRDFVKAGVAAGAMTTVGALPLAAAKRTATDTVTLGKSSLQVTRLAFGTGTDSGAVQAALGQKEFTRLVRYA